jgi:hypothetical protein
MTCKNAVNLNTKSDENNRNIVKEIVKEIRNPIKNYNFG